ncbi:hypothetical protein [Nocardioides convexus]|uniref:hypothetical protein n=1 Tax=Nocardioides convexus TaxID=2712224 RepID=UPI0024188C1E|nr:hypothetical protein [Nocardioides convexus]
MLGFVLGTVLALARLSRNPLFNGLAWLYIWFFRSLPLPVLFIIVYNLSQFFPTLALKIPFLPALFSTETPLLLAPLVAGVVGLTINEAAYAAEPDPRRHPLRRPGSGRGRQRARSLAAAPAAPGGPAAGAALDRPRLRQPG